jgi:ELWxxDGT repeat protein
MTTCIRFSFLLALIGLSTYVFGQSVQLASFESDQYGGPSKEMEYNGKLYFSAWDAATGRELWVTDGTAQGTYMLRDCVHGAEGSVFYEVTKVGYMLYFIGGNGAALWRSDGTNQGTTAVQTFQV